MKQFYLAVPMLLLAFYCSAQSDTTAQNTDTMKVGNFIIIKKNKSGSKNPSDSTKDKHSVEININFGGKDKQSKKSNENKNTNWFILDLGFANYNDKTNYSNAITIGYVNASRPVSASDMNLNAGKSSNVNIWFAMKRTNIYKEVVNLKYGVGLEMYNFRLDNNISYRKNPSPYILRDSVNFTKNKLYVGYLTVPLMLNINTNPSGKNPFGFSAGLSAGYLIGSHTKQISAERGKEKFRNNFNLNPWKLAAIGELSIGGVRLYGSYSLTALHKESTNLEQFPYSVGVRFSKW